VSDNATSYPLSWPRSKPRTPANERKFAPFGRRTADRESNYSRKHDLTIAEAYERLERELVLLDKTLDHHLSAVVISTNVELRVDGRPRSDRRAPDDPGAAVYFRVGDRPVVLACDKYRTVAGNLAAIAAHIDGMRATERHGVGTLHELFTGFMALPGATSVNDWRKALGEPRSLAEAESAYRERARTAHPDTGGSTAKMAELNAAIAAARAHFGGKT